MQTDILGYGGHALSLARHWAVVLAQLVERLLPSPEVRGSNPVIG